MKTRHRISTVCHCLLVSSVIGFAIVGHPARAVETRVTTSLQFGQLQLTVDPEVGVTRFFVESSTTLADAGWSVRKEQSAAPPATSLLAFPITKQAEFFRVRTFNYPSFCQRITSGLTAVRAAYPEAELYEVQMQFTAPVAQVDDRVLLKMVFRVNGGIVKLESPDPWTIGSPQFTAGLWVGDRVIALPLGLELFEADGLLKQAGYVGLYDTITLRWPVYYTMTQPYYIFGTVVYGYVFVGSNDRKVFVGQ
jgi:hypothetical protein